LAPIRTLFRRAELDENLTIFWPRTDPAGAECCYKSSCALTFRRDNQRTFRWEKAMTWTAPEVCEICCGMEVTSYMSAEI
jgi:coenzyme PQQ precursor peptide PqqA